MTVFGTLLARQHFRRTGKASATGSFPSVSILKPVKGVDAEFEIAIESFFKLLYAGTFEMIFCLETADDPAYLVLTAIRNRYPDVDARILIGEGTNTPNPKVSNIQKGYALAKYDIILISDSNVMATKDYLTNILPRLKNDAGLVTGVVIGRGASTLAGWLECATLNTFSNRWMLLANKFGAPIVMGKSMLFRKSEVERFGGLKSLGLFLAEDYVAGSAMKYLNKKVVTATEPVYQNLAGHDFNTYWSRHIRWGRLRRAQAAPAFWLEPLITCTLSGLIGAASLAFLTPLSGPAIFLCHLALWLLADLYLLSIVHAPGGIPFVLAWILKELLYLPMWLQTLLRRTVQWRGRKLTLQPGGMLSQ